MTGKIIERRSIYDRWTSISEVLLHMPNGAMEKRVVEDHGDAAAVLPYDPDRRVALMVRQPRAPLLHLGLEEHLLEVVAGGMDGKSGEATARAEAWEEAGVQLGALEHVATLWTMPAVSTERLELYLAPYSMADRSGPGGGGEGENECISVEEVGLVRLRDLMATKGIADGKTFTLLQALMVRRPELFE